MDLFSVIFDSLFLTFLYKAHGFEILCSKSEEFEEGTQNGHAVRPNDVRWRRYLQSLKEKGYFKVKNSNYLSYQ